jgi:hypothetical protein
MKNLNKSEGLSEIASKEKIPLRVAQLDVDNDLSVDWTELSANKRNYC